MPIGFQRANVWTSTRWKVCTFQYSDVSTCKHSSALPLFINICLIPFPQQLVDELVEVTIPSLADEGDLDPAIEFFIEIKSGMEALRLGGRRLISLEGGLLVRSWYRIRLVKGFTGCNNAGKPFFASTAHINSFPTA